MPDPQQTAPTKNQADANMSELRALQAQVAELKEKLASIHAQSDVEYLPVENQPWVRIAATVAVTFALGKVIQALRLPAATAVAIPMITSEVNRRFL